MKKVIVIGSPGAGKSTFARALRDRTGLPLYYLDMIWHRPDQTNRSPKDFDVRLGELIQKDRWIIDGNYLRTLELRLSQCDTAFLLDYPPEVCLAGAEARVGKEREDLPWVEERLEEEFRQSILDFPQEQLPEIYRLCKKYEEKNIICFHTREEAEAYLLQWERGKRALPFPEK